MRIQPRDLLLPLIVFAALIGLSVHNRQVDLWAAHERVRQTDQLICSITADRIAGYLDERSQDLQSLCQARIAGNLDTATEFHQRASGLRDNHPEYYGISWVDPRGKIRWSVTDGGADRYVGTDMNTLPGRRALLQAAAGATRAVLSPVFRLIDGEAGLLIAIAVRRAGRLDGFVVGGLQGKVMVHNAVPTDYRGLYGVDVREKGGTDPLFQTGRVLAEHAATTRSAMGRTFAVQVWLAAPTRAVFEDPDFAIVFAINTVLALSLSGLVLALQAQQRRALGLAAERQRAGEELVVSEQRLREIVDHSPWVVVEYAPDGRIEYVNPAGEALYGLPRAEMVGRDPIEWVYPEDRERTRANIARYRPTSAEEPAPLRPFENRNVDREGRLHYMRWTGGRRIDTRGKVIGTVSYGLDITAEVMAAHEREDLMAEQARLVERLSMLNEFARSLRSTLDIESLMPIAVRVAPRSQPGTRGVLLRAGPATGRLATVAVDAEAGPPVDGVRPPGQAFDIATTALAPLLQEDTADLLVDLTIAQTPYERDLAAAGYAIYVAVPVVEENGRTYLLLTLYRSPSEHTRDQLELMRGVAAHLALALTNARLYGEMRSAFDRLQAAQDQMVQMEKLRAVGQMAAGVAHDFNNALTAVVGYAELLAGRVTGEEETTYLRRILQAAHDAAETVRRIQDFSRRAPDPETFVRLDARTLVTESVALTRHRWRDQAQGSGATIEMRTLLPERPVYVRGNPAELREVLTNLIFNAVDAMPRGGHLTLRVETAEERGIIAVEDTGVGMEEEVLRQVFEPFFTTRGVEGTGLGLSVSYGIIRRHGGEITAQSVPGEGARFTVSLPLAGEMEARPQPRGPRPAVPSCRILIVDDDSSVREVVTAMARSLGHEVQAVASGALALQRLQEGAIDVLVTDLGMPGMSGLELAAAARRAYPRLRIVLLTGWGDQVRGEGQTPEGVDVVLGKPIRPAQLQAVLGAGPDAGGGPGDGSASSGI